MRILRVAQKVYPDVKGGGAYHVHAMSRDQAAMGHDVTVLTVRWDEDSPREERRDGYTVVRRDPSVTLLGNDISTGVARYLWRSGNFDVLHAHSHLYFSTNLAAMRRRLGGPPLAVTNHGLYSQTVPEWLFDWYLRTLGRWTFNRADVVFCYTDTDLRRLRRRGVDTNVAVVSNGVDTNRFSPDGPTSEHLDAGRPTVLFVGRLVDGKRPRDAVEAVAQLVDSRPDTHLAIAGEGPLRSILEKDVESAELTDNVSFLGHISYDDMPALYRTADVLALPSRAEGLPRTVLEALAVETPVVTSDLDQLRDITNCAGHRVSVGDVTALATSIGNLLSDNETRANLGRTGRHLVETKYDWSNTVTQTTKHLSSLRE